MVHPGELVSVFDVHVVGQEIALVAIVVQEGVEPVEAVILNKEIAEPWSSGHLGYSAEVAH